MAPADTDVNAVLGAPVLGPPTAVEGAYEAAVRLVRGSRCRVVRFRPGAGRYPLADWVLSPLPELSAAEGASLVLDYAPEPIAWNDVVAFARSYPTAPMVVGGVVLRQEPAAAAALDATANLILHVSDDDASELARLVGVFGEHRFLANHGETAAILLRGDWRSLYL